MKRNQCLLLLALMVGCFSSNIGQAQTSAPPAPTKTPRPCALVPLLLSYGGIEEGLRKRLSGMDFKMPSQALLPDPRIAAWVTVRATADSTSAVAKK